jgi:hypothetical protein
MTGIAVALVLAMCQPSSVFAQNASAANQSPGGAVRVPFVGCASDGQIGPLKAPKGKGNVVAISPEAARRLAYYKAAQGPGVLAPRGWHCFGTYGSNGSNLYVSPNPIGDPLQSAGPWAGLTGAAVQLSEMFGRTSGRFEVARKIARVFPAHMAFAQTIISERIEPASSFPQGPYPDDKLVYRNKEVVEYETPPNQAGLGTSSQLKKNASPITGVAILTGETPDLIQLSVRLPRGATDLGPAITRQLEHEYGT